MQLTRTQVACLSLCAQQTGGRALLRPIAIVCYGSSFNGSIQCARMLVKQLVVMCIECTRAGTHRNGCTGAVGLSIGRTLTLQPFQNRAQAAIP